MSKRPVEVDLAIVGYGPVGVSAANLMGERGVRTVVLERDRDIYPRARAVTVNDWTMRIFQSMGLDGALKADMDVNGALTWKVYQNKKTVFSMMPESLGQGHAASYMIYQPVMEQTLREGVERYADHVQVRFGQSVSALEQDDAGVTVSTESGDQVRARYVLACDGGSSRMRRAAGSELHGSTLEVVWIVIDAEVLRGWPGSHDLVFWSDPDRPVVDIPLARGHHRWELPLRDFETQETFDSEEAIWALLAPLGVGPEQIRLKQHAFYSHHVRHADRWRQRRVLLAGDAAHLMPPWAGQGMQSGIRDAHNVCWKLAEVLAGRLDESVLDTYQAERAPHVAEATELSQKMGMLIASRDPRFIRMRNTIGPLIMRSPALTRRLMKTSPPALSEGWLAGDGPAVGAMFPQPPVWDAGGRDVVLDDVLGSGFAVVGYDEDPRRLLDPAALSEWDRLGARLISVRSTNAAARSDEDVVDHTGQLARWMKQHRTTAVALRPDRFVASSQDSGVAVPSLRQGVPA